MSTVRRIELALAVLALALSGGASLPPPAAAHVDAGLALEWIVRPDELGTVVAGIVTNHTSSRRDIQVTATWRDGDTVVAEKAVFTYMFELAPHASTPFRILESADVDGATLTVSVTSSDPIANSWAGPLAVEPGTLTGDTYTGTVRNDSEFDTRNVHVFAVRRQNGIIVDASSSLPIANLAAGESATYTINFDNVAGDTVGSLMAQSLGADFTLTSWSNWFGDLGNSDFAEEIAWLANDGITLGCGFQAFCPTSAVTRGQMALFLDRALDLPTATGDPPFTDIGSRPAGTRQAIANLYAAGITSGCSATRFCPTAPVTRGQMSKFIVLGYELAPIAGPGPFTDDKGLFSEPYNNRIAADGITSGCAAGLFCPQASVTREQMAKFIFEAEH